MSTQSFIKQIAQGAIEAYKEYGVLPSLTIAQGILESASGRASIGNNIFGIKANKSWKGKKQLVWTWEVYNGVKTKIQANFRDYDSIEDSIIDHAKLLSMPRYKPVIAAKDYKEACIQVQKCGYATDPKYSFKLIKIIEANKLYLYDEQVKAKPIVAHKPIVAPTDMYDKLVVAKIISSPTYWRKNCVEGGQVKGEFARAVILNFYTTSISGKVNFEEALNYALDNEIVSSLEYWKENCISGKTVKGEFMKVVILRISKTLK